MREIVRGLDGASECPRCGRPVRYKGRGRPPVWCSSECRIEASIERKGNRAVGIQPEVVKVVPMHTKLTEYEKARRAEIDAHLPSKAAVTRVASRPDLVDAVLNLVAMHQPNTGSLAWQNTANKLRMTADAISPGRCPADGALPQPGGDEAQTSGHHRVGLPARRTRDRPGKRAGPRPRPAGHLRTPQAGHRKVRAPAGRVGQILSCPAGVERRLVTAHQARVHFRAPSHPRRGRFGCPPGQPSLSEVPVTLGGVLDTTGV